MPTGARPAGTAAQPCTTAETRPPEASGIAKPLVACRPFLHRPVMVCGFGHRVCPRKPGCVPMPLRTLARPGAKAQQSRGFYLTHVLGLPPMQPLRLCVISTGLAAPGHVSVLTDASGRVYRCLFVTRLHLLICVALVRLIDRSAVCHSVHPCYGPTEKPRFTCSKPIYKLMFFVHRCSVVILYPVACFGTLRPLGLMVALLSGHGLCGNASTVDKRKGRVMLRQRLSPGQGSCRLMHVFGGLQATNKALCRLGNSIPSARNRS